MEMKVYEIFRREIEGTKYRYISNRKNRKEAIDRATRCALKSEKRFVFCVYEMDADILKTRTASRHKPAGTLIFEIETVYAKTVSCMKKRQVTL